MNKRGAITAAEQAECAGTAIVEALFFIKKVGCTTTARNAYVVLSWLQYVTTAGLQLIVDTGDALL